MAAAGGLVAVQRVDPDARKEQGAPGRFQSIRVRELAGKC